MHTGLRWVALAASGLLALLACDDGLLKVDDFDQSCDVNDDCVAVTDLGQCCTCSEAAINRADLAAYEAAIDCPVCASDCPTVFAARCNEGTCEAYEAAVCVPGVQSDCTDGCTSGTGTHTCLEDGSGYGVCSCSL